MATVASDDEAGGDGGYGGEANDMSIVLRYISGVTKKHHVIMVIVVDTDHQHWQPEDQRVSRCWAPGHSNASNEHESDESVGSWVF